MSDLGKVPAGLFKAMGSDLFWGVALSEVRGNLSTGEVIIVFPLASGLMILELGKIDGTGFPVSGN
jgi:hypothetical protein